MNSEFDCVLVRYGEIFLKGPTVRREFELRLASNISDCLDRAGIDHTLSRTRGRMIIKTSIPKEACTAISKVFGVVSVSPAVTIESNLQAIGRSVLRLATGKIDVDTSFAIDTNRGNKSFPKTSQDVNTEIGEMVRMETGGRVDLGNPSVTIGIDIRERTYIFDEIISGPLGLPLGTAGRTLSLFSGGIDSPVATYMMMKRGCEQVLLYLDNTPFTGADSMQRAIEVAKVLNSYSYGSRMKFLMVPHGHSLSSFIKKCPHGLTCTLCKRMMTRVAEEVARIEGCSAIINGSSLAQVCSQTMTNLALTISATSMPVLMPLVGFDKEETIKIAKNIGTYKESSSPVTPCSAVPRWPRTRPGQRDIESAESKVDIQNLLKCSIDGIKEIDLS